MKISKPTLLTWRFALGLSLAIFSLSLFVSCNTNKSMAIQAKRIHANSHSVSELEEKEGKHKKKGKDMYDGPEEAAEFEFMQIRDPATGEVPSNRLMDAIEQTVAAKARVDGSFSNGLKPLAWAERGPYADVVGPSNGNTRANSGITAGRIRAVMVDKRDNTGKTVWVGGVNGGVWRTTDITASTPDWVLINDFLSNLAVTGICQDPTNLNTMYFCTGEAYSNADRVNGNGVFKSTDGGASWTQLSSTTAYTLCSKIQCDAAGNVYLGTNLLSTGLLRSKDGGSTWTTITPTGLSTRITDFEISSTGRFHVAVGYRQNDGFYRYTDNPSTVTSATWTAPTTPFTYPTGNLSRVELACLGNTLYAVPSNATGVMSQIHKSTDGGVTWTTTALTTTNINDLNGSTTSGQGWYCIGIDIDPSNANTAIVGGLKCLKTTDGGATWSKISEWVGTVGQYVHADIQNIIWYDGGNKLVIACDGGIHYSSDKGTTFRDRNTNLRLKQFYACAIHPTSTNYFLAGAQDNGTHQLNGAGIASSVEVTGGDGAFVAIDQNEPQFQFGAYVYNQYRRSLNGGANWSSINFSGSAGLFINPWDYDNANNRLYGAWSAGSLLRWDNPSVAATTSAFSITVPDFNGATVSHVKVSPYTNNLVYFGTNAGRIIKMTNANVTASIVTTNITAPTMPAGNVSCINTGTDDNNLIMCFSNYGISSIWVTPNGGTSWSAIEGNLPDMPVRWVMFFPDDNTRAYAATETGVWETALINGAATVWTPNPTFPTVKTNMLKYRPSDYTIIASTHGRGLWTATVPVCLPINFTAPVVTNVKCAGGNSGKVVVSATGGIGGITYSISPNIGTQSPAGTFNGLTAGTYTFTATDGNLCTNAITATVGTNPNLLPIVSLTAPANGAIFASSTTLTATASDADGTIARVNFYLVIGTTKTGGIARQLLGSDNTAPYSFNWMNIPGNIYTIQAEAIDDCNASVFSNTATVNVLETFTVLITSPVTGQSVVPGSSITIGASVTSFTSRTVAKVEFFYNGVKLGEDLTAPYTYFWNNIPTGNITLQAVATDNLGGVWYSPYTFIIGRNSSISLGASSVSPTAMSLSPNPTSTQVNVRSTVAEDGYYGLNIIDALGRTVLSKQLTYQKGTYTETLDVSNFAKGLYFVRLANADGKDASIQKLIVE